VSTLTLYAVAVYARFCEAAIVLAWGVTAVGLVGVLLAVCAPESTCAVAVDTTADGSWNVIDALVAAVLAI
jgi:hypothetical protein